MTFATLFLYCLCSGMVYGLYGDVDFQKSNSISFIENILIRNQDDPSLAWVVEYIENFKHGELLANEHTNYLMHLTSDQLEKLRSQPGMRDFPCPLDTDIAPCLCYYDQDFNVDLNCTAVASEDQLASIFQKEFPDKNLRRFYMSSNTAIRVLRNILNGVTFQEITLFPGHFALEEVSEYFILSLEETLINFFVQNSLLDSDLFPFFALNSLEELTNLDIFYSNMTWIPKLQNPKLMYVRFHYSFIDSIEPGTFDDLPSLTYIQLDHNLITRLDAGTFPIRDVDTSFILHDNAIETVEPGTFYFAHEHNVSVNATIKIELHNNRLQSLQAGTFFFTDSLVIIYLTNNIISSIEPGTFVMPYSTDNLSITLNVDHNQLSTFDEAVFGDLLPFTTQLLADGNPFECGCDVAWLVLNPLNMAKVDNLTKCRDGTFFHDLNPASYLNVCKQETSLSVADVWKQTFDGAMKIVNGIWGGQ